MVCVSYLREYLEILWPNCFKILLQGICPGNRLRLIAGVFEDTGQSREPSPQLTEVFSDLSTLQRQGKRRSWHVQPNKVLTPKKYNDVYLYDIPPRAIPVSYDAPRNCSRCSPAPSCASPTNRDSGDSYDIPRPILIHPSLLTPSSSASSLTTGDSLSSSNRSSVINIPDYDVPRSHPRGTQLVLQPATLLYDVPPSHPQVKELPLELSFALDSLEKLQNEVTAAISKLLAFVSPHWRTREKLETNIMDIKLSVMRLRTSLQDLAEFGEGALGNATRATDKNLASKLMPLIMAIRTSDRLVQEAADQLQLHDWSIDILSRTENEGKAKPDALEQLVACARSLTEDVRQTSSFIQGNSTLLFKRATSPQGSNNSNEWLEDYDYVNLESKEAVAQKHAEIRDALPKELKKGYDNLIKNAESAAIISDKADLDPEDKQVLSFFAAQVITHHNHLTQAIDAFLQTVEHNQPPKVFLAHGKFVVLSAHKLVHIGDAVHRNVLQTDTRTRALNCANALSEALAMSVSKTKQAALQFPSVTAVQAMVDSIVDISHLAKDLKICLVQAAQPM
ncbi:hypothetical protein PPYR_10609 [Photinus pyralis]|uniref:Breast cancer anti-estrogen resistance protein 1 n=1 Tax=Photinus pyralis TaxID=7054 RepID=A0A5N4AH55_PHOPY|nr:breast cancer anti-estrogen resistance protein 1-like [Photinus pyralis]KAB0796548.1 hypothetical protein PPYR_10609 [Photinus pyralis]